MTHLTEAELRALTNGRTVRQQIAALVRLGIPFRFGGGVVEVSRDVARELPQWRSVEACRAPRLDMVR